MLLFLALVVVQTSSGSADQAKVQIEQITPSSGSAAFVVQTPSGARAVRDPQGLGSDESRVPNLESRRPSDRLPNVAAICREAELLNKPLPDAIDCSPADVPPAVAETAGEAEDALLIGINGGRASANELGQQSGDQLSSDEIARRVATGDFSEGRSRSPSPRQPAQAVAPATPPRGS